MFQIEQSQGDRKKSAFYPLRLGVDFNAAASGETPTSPTQSVTFEFEFLDHV